MSQTIEPTAIAVPAESGPIAMELDQPIPMSFPAVLRDMGTPRFNIDTETGLPKEKPRRVLIKGGKLGKQWVRRKENAQFTANPHIMVPTVHDLNSPLPPHRAWPQPLPGYIPRKVDAPDWVPPVSVPVEQRLSRKGVRKHLRSAGPFAERLVRAFEAEITQWLESTVVFNPDNQQVRRRIGTEGSVHEVSHTHPQLVWMVPSDGFARYVIHAVARFHGLVSFSKDAENGERMTHILRPRVQVTRSGIMSLDTPSATATDIDSGSEVMVSDQDAISEAGLDALTEEEDDGGFVVVGDKVLARVPEDVDIASKTNSPVREAEVSVEGMISSLVLDDATPRPARRLDGRSAILQSRLRSGSSPSPARRSIRSGRSSARGSVRNQPLRMFTTSSAPQRAPSSFWEYVYS